VATPKSDGTIIIITKEVQMIAVMVPMFAAAGYSMLYLLFGGGIGGAILIFFVAKMFGK
jgi:hypothetical protein